MKSFFYLALVVVLCITLVGCKQTPKKDSTNEKPEVAVKDTPESEVIPATKPEVAPTTKPEVVPTTKPEVVPTTKPEIAPTTKPLKKITICLAWQTQCQFAGFYAALEKGFYREEGLDVTLKPGGPKIRPSEEVSSKRVQFGVGQAQEVLLCRDKGIPVQAVSTDFQIGALRLVSYKDIGIAAPMDLEGKKISLWFGGYEYQCLGLLEKFGITKDSVELLKQGWTMDAFCNNEVDVASVMTYNELNTLYEKGIKDIDILSYADYGLNFPEDTIFALEEYIQQNPALVAKTLKASYRGWQWSMKHPEEAVKIVMKYNDKLTEDHESRMLREVFKLMITKNTKKFGLGYFHKPDWVVMAKILFQQKLLNEIPDINKAINSSFIDGIKIFPPKNIK